MRAVIIAIAAVTLFITSSCIPSIHPIYDEDTRVYDAELLGTWKSVDAPESTEAWMFGHGSRESENYLFVQTDEAGLVGRFTVNMAEIGGARFIDFFPEDDDREVNGFYEIHKFRVHTFMKVEFEGDTLRLYLLDFNWLDEHLKSSPDAVAHNISDRMPEMPSTDSEFPLLTARTPELQAWLESIVDEPEAWSDPMELSRWEE